jgi:HK97 family phage major capsid protein
MTEFLRYVKSLLSKGFATKEEKTKVAEKLKDLSAEEQEVAQPEADKVDALPEQETEDTDGEVQKTLKSMIKHATSEAIPEIKSEIKQYIEDTFAAMAKKAGALNVKPEAVIDEEKFKEWAKAVKSGQKADFSFEIKGIGPEILKTVGPISESGSLTGEWPQAELEPGIYRGPQREPFVEDLVSVGTITSNLDAWIEVTDGEGNPAPVAELAAIPAKDYDYVRRTAEVKKIGVHSKYSAEIAEDLPSLVSELRNYLVSDLRRVVDAQLLSGDGTGENLVGILENATDFAAGALAGSVAEPNNFDVIEAAVTQVIVALHQPTHVVVHPTDRAKMRLAKGSDGHYVLPPFIMSDGSTVSGVRVVANTGITAGKFLVGDFRKSSVKYKRSLSVEFSNSDQDDFVKDRFTVKATVRLVHRVKENDYEAYVYGDFSDAIEALDSGEVSA